MTMIKVDNAHYTPIALLKALLFGDVGWGEEFVKGNIALANKNQLVRFLHENRGAPRLFPYFRSKNKGSDIHYNLPAEFFKRLLGPSMSYTCGSYCGVESFTLEQAQNEKHQWHEERLKLKDGLSLFECGFGWGGFRKHLGGKARFYKGISISESQQEYCEQLMAGTGNYGGINQFLLKDWRDGYGQPHDRFVSIGMLEHVGQDNLPAFFKFVRGSLTRSGQGTLQFISRDKPISCWADKYIFPGAEPPNFNEVARLMRQNHLIITEARECGSDYVLTLKAWLKNLENNKTWIIEKFGLKFYRTFVLYLNGGICSFESGDSQLMQLAFEVQG